MSAMPFFTAMTQKESMRAAAPTSKALMFAAGETGTRGGLAGSSALRLAEWHPGRWHIVLGDGGVERDRNGSHHRYAEGRLRQGTQGAAGRLRIFAARVLNNPLLRTTCFS